MADQQQQTDDKPLAATNGDNNDMVVEGGGAQQDNGGLGEPSPAKRVRVEETTVDATLVQPLKDIDTSVDVSKLSSTQIKQQMEEILAHCQATGRTVDKLPVKERVHFSKLTLCLDERAVLAQKHFEEMKKEGVMHPGDADIWIDMLTANDMDPYAKDNIATYAAASRSYARKREDERDDALKRLRNAEDEIKTLKSQVAQQPAMAMGKPVTTFAQQVQQQQQSAAKQQQQQTPNEMKVKAVSTYYHKFGENEFAPKWGQNASSASLEKNSLGMMLSDAIMMRVGQQKH
jgi:hypothetical protein